MIPPPVYMDGCTLFPDRFGKVSHRPACDRHDDRYWRWLPIVVLAVLVGLVGLLTGGWWFWNRRHRFGPR